ncbi:MAG: diguanylate cyclase [Pelolinea sp.]|nr:diguanylate cyclase [Pelolinea sp.]
MLFSFPPFSIAYAIAAVLSLLSAAAVMERKANPGNRLFALLMLSLSVWSIASIFEAGALSAAGKLTWSKWQYFGVVSISPLWLLFTAEYTNQKKFMSSSLRHLVWVIPIITLVLAFTNEYHDLLWKEIYIPENAVNHVAIYDHGFWFVIHIGFSYFVLVIGTYWLIKALLNAPRKKRGQAAVIFISMVISWASNIIYVLGFSPVKGLDITTLSFTFVALVLTWMIFGNRLFDLIPIARNALVDNMTDGVIVLDPDDRVIDINPAAIKLAGYEGPSPIGLSIWEMFIEYLDLIEPLRDKQNVHTELTLPGDQPRYLDVKIDSIPTGDKATNGQLITIRNITRRKTSELKEQEQRQFTEVLVDTASIINSSLNLDEVLSHILENVDKVVPHDSANIALVDEYGVARFLKVKGYEKYGTREQILSIECRVEEIPNLKKMAESGKPSINPDTLADPEWIKDLPGSGWIRSYIGAPIKRKDKLLGFINLDAATPNFFKTNHLSRLQALADQAAIAIENARLFKEMEQLAITDSLTGIYNRRFFFAFAENEIERTKRYNKNLSIIMIDIDHFKDVNDRFGHQIGDQVLKEIADICLSILRKVDVMCRYGGEEFTVLLPETEESDAAHAAERMCTAISSSRFKTEKGDVTVSVSIGVAELDKSRGSLEKLLAAADQALYTAKETGRNRVHVI